MKLTYGQFPGLVTTMQKIKTGCALPVVKALQLKRAFKKIDEELKLNHELREEILDRHAKKDEEGKRLTQEMDGNSFFMIIDVNAFNAEILELAKQEFEIDDIYLSEEDLSSIKLTVDDLDVLEPFMQEPPKPKAVVSPIAPKNRAARRKGAK